ncbi:MAG TPA: thioesterase family protein [Planctomycetota bacterium]|nr:thioesterase family protein [Planctomycetota bacterium]
MARSDAPATWREHRLRVRYGETDQMGVVYHANYLVYMEEGRTRLMEALGCSYSELERSGWALVVRKAELRYRAPARYDEELIIRTAVDRVGGGSVRFVYEVRRAADGTLLAEGSTELACLDRRAGDGKAALLPERVRELLDA